MDPTETKSYKLNFDGATSGNLGEVQSIGVIKNKKGEIKFTYFRYIIKTFDNQTEVVTLAKGGLCGAQPRITMPVETKGTQTS